jgi:phosphotriesterase-related protein
MTEDGYGDRLLLSHDIFLKYCLTKYGGFGYAHIPENIVPWLRGLGASADDIEQVLVENPRDALTFAEPEG